jgi:hypothetical protein
MASGKVIARYTVAAVVVVTVVTSLVLMFRTSAPSCMCSGEIVQFDSKGARIGVYDIAMARHS